MIKRILNNVWFDISHPSLAIFRVYLEFIYTTIHARLTKSRDYSSEVFFLGAIILPIFSFWYASGVVELGVNKR
jgi:hypothetical protein